MRSLVAVCALLSCASPRYKQESKPHFRYPRMQLVATVDASDLKRLSETAIVADSLKSPVLVVQINSVGGDVDVAQKIVVMFDRVKAEGIRVDCVVDGQAYSAALYILQGCSRRYMTKRSLLMAHQPSAEKADGGSLTQNEEQEMAAVKVAFAEHIIRRMTISRSMYERNIDDGKQWWIGWEDALRLGAIDSIVDDAWNLPL